METIYDLEKETKERIEEEISEYYIEKLVALEKNIIIAKKVLADAEDAIIKFKERTPEDVYAESITEPVNSLWGTNWVEGTLTAGDETTLSNT